ncbi:MAG: TIGR02452 family protein [Bacteroidales bacterium]|nr:TIGR02452 family protein [Bacteroidales bacterium]
MVRRNEQKVAIFEDTMRRCDTVPETEFIFGDIKIEPKPGKCKVKVIDSDTFTACRPGDVALNFASGWVPGGGVTKGSTAQEEDLCRRSSLYRGLTSPEGKPFYNANHRRPNISTNAMLLSHDVEVIKDKNYDLLRQPFEVDVLTVAAPRLCDGMPCTQEELDEILRGRIEATVKTLAAKGYRRAILGAWGCGAYGNDPVAVARYFHESLDRYAGYFDEIIFAIPLGRRDQNLYLFSQEFK